MQKMLFSIILVKKIPPIFIEKTRLPLGTSDWLRFIQQTTYHQYKEYKILENLF